MDPGPIDAEISRWLRAQRMRGDFAGVHALPSTAAEVPDQAGVRLVVLGPEHPHREDDAGSPALVRAAALVEDAAGGPRAYRNMLVFLAGDARRLEELRAGDGPLAGGDVGATWEWLLAPSGAGWTATRAPGREDVAMRAGRGLRASGGLFAEYPPARLRDDLDRVPLWPAGRDHVALGEVWEAYARSLELPRLRSSAVLAAAVLAGLGRADWERETFAYAESFDPDRRRYDGLVAGHAGSLALRGSGLVVRAAAARAQLDAEAAGR
jgi:hypothetical protein